MVVWVVVCEVVGVNVGSSRCCGEVDTRPQSAEADTQRGPRGWGGVSDGNGGGWGRDAPAVAGGQLLLALPAGAVGGDGVRAAARRGRAASAATGAGGATDGLTAALPRPRLPHAGGALLPAGGIAGRACRQRSCRRACAERSTGVSTIQRPSPRANLAQQLLATQISSRLRHHRHHYAMLLCSANHDTPVLPTTLACSPQRYWYIGY